MSSVLLAWELGGGMGHLVNLLPVARGLSERGHRVFVALRDLSRAQAVFGRLGVTLLQSPYKAGRVSRRIEEPRTFAHLLYNCGFGDSGALAALCAAWRSIYDLIEPDLIVCDHSPTALLAARGRPARRALIGTGFFCPLDESPLPDLRRNPPVATKNLAADEDVVLQFANRALRSWGEGPLERISRLYYDVDEHFLVTFAELDHYGQRQGVRYWGAWPNVGGKPVEWPKGAGVKIYAYLKPFSALRSLLIALRELGNPTVVYVDGMSPQVQDDFRSPTLRFEQQGLDLAQVGRECDLAILNGNHGTAVSLLLAGKPTLQIPLFLEQGLFSAALARLGAGLSAGPDQRELIILRLIAMLSTSRFQEGARAFADKYRDFSSDRAVADVVERAEELAAPR